MGPTLTYQSKFGRILAIVTIGLCVVAIGSFIFTGHASDLAIFGAPLALIALIAWMGFYTPVIQISDGGVTMRNFFHTVEIRWPAVERLETRLGLRVVTAFGGYDAWSAPAPGRFRGRRMPTEATITPEDEALGQPVSISGNQVVLALESRWESLRSAGYLDNPNLEESKPIVTTHRVENTAFGVLCVLTVVGILVG